MCSLMKLFYEPGAIASGMAGEPPVWELPPTSLLVTSTFLLKPSLFIRGVVRGSLRGSSNKGMAKVSSSFLVTSVIAALLASLSAFLFPLALSPPPVWCPLQLMTATSFGAHTASKSCSTYFLFFISFPSVVNNPLSLYMAPWACKVAKAYLESV